ncbi:MAG: hypothetical protein JW889_09510 [Verrucomicrobia bacterium]|nr:hypothetical protein [Verrucomicrobiota bacterium]
MALAQALADFRMAVQDCNELVLLAYNTDAQGSFVATACQRQKIVTAAFLSFFLAWEAFVESAVLDYMTGEPSVLGRLPVRLANPPSRQHALDMLIGTQRFFDFGNHDYTLRAAKLFLDSGGPIGTYFPTITQALADLRTMRNASAHITATAQSGLDGLAQRILGPAAVIPCRLGEFLLAQHPHDSAGITIFAHYQRLVDVAAELIANG